MKTNLLFIMMLFFCMNSYGQEKEYSNNDKPATNCCKGDSAECLQANGSVLLQSKKSIKHGSVLCIKVSGVNTFLTKSFSTYKPINYDFSTAKFQELKLDEKTAKIVDTDGRKLSPNIRGKIERRLMLSNEISLNKEKIEMFAKDTLTSEKAKEIIRMLEDSNKILNEKIIEIEREINKISEKNKQLEKEIESLKNIAQKSSEFKKEFKTFQNGFQKINSYSSLRNILLNQIKKDSVFILDTENFKKRATSSFTSIYDDSNDLSNQKKLIVNEIANLEESYLKLAGIYQELNNEHKSNKLKLSGELKDGKNILKFDKIEGNFETKYFFEDEMKKVRAINDSLSLPKNARNIIAEAQEGIDLYDEIKNCPFTSTIVSQNIYDDEAEITPQLKNSKGKVLYEYNKIKVKTYGNLKINGSAGYFFNFISDDNYSLRKKSETDPTSKTGVTESNSNILKHSLGGLLHAYYNTKYGVDYGFSVGLSINDNANAGFYFGASGFFTETNRLVLTSGVSFIKVNRLNTANLVLENGSYNFTNESDTEIRYDEVYKPSFFIGISYNLF